MLHVYIHWKHQKKPSVSDRFRECRNVRLGLNQFNEFNLVLSLEKTEVIDLHSNSIDCFLPKNKASLRWIEYANSKFIFQCVIVWSFFTLDIRKNQPCFKYRGIFGTNSDGYLRLLQHLKWSSLWHYLTAYSLGGYKTMRSDHPNNIKQVRFWI